MPMPLNSHDFCLFILPSVWNYSQYYCERNLVVMINSIIDNSLSFFMFCVYQGDIPSQYGPPSKTLICQLEILAAVTNKQYQGTVKGEL